MAKNTIKVALFLSFWVLYVVGCDPVYEPIKLKNPNTFMHGPKWDGGQILEVIVWHAPKSMAGESSDRRQPVWQIKATKKIPARRFVVTVGEIPEGFQQIIPNPPEKPVLLPGEHYAIGIESDTYRSFTHPVEWTAK
jgi:hypothetical protein